MPLRNFLEVEFSDVPLSIGVNVRFVLFFTTEAVAGGVANGPSRPSSPAPTQAADVAIEIDEDPNEAADSEPLVSSLYQLY